MIGASESEASTWTHISQKAQSYAGLARHVSVIAIKEWLNNLRLGRPGLSVLTIEEWLNNQRLGKPGLSVLAIKEWQNNQRLGRPGLKDNTIKERLTRTVRLKRQRSSEQPKAKHRGC